MPNDNQNTNPSQPAGDVSVVPVFSPQADLPPLPPDYQNVPVAAVSEPTSVTSGSAAPPPLPSMVSPSSKKKFGGGRIIATILGLLLLVGGIGAGILLTNQLQLFEQKAATCPGGYDVCRQTKGAQVCNCDCNGICTRPDSGGGTGATTTIVSCSTSGAAQCGVTPSGCGGFCILPVDKTCDDMLRQECNFEPVRGANYIEVENGSTCPSAYPTKCQCAVAPTGQVCFDRGFTTQCAGTDGLCALFGNSQASGGAGGVACGTTATYYCQGVDYLSSGKSCDTSTGGTTTKPANFCGTVQVDTACQGFKSTYVPCASKPPTSTPPSTPGPTASCQNIKAYSSTYTLLTSAQLSNLTRGTAINFCVVGSATAGSFDKAKFTINSVAQAETTTKRPGTQDYCQSYVIPATGNTFNITAQIHHLTLGWK